MSVTLHKMAQPATDSWMKNFDHNQTQPTANEKKKRPD